MADLRAQLHSGFSGSYVLERGVGRGGTAPYILTVLDWGEWMP